MNHIACSSAAVAIRTARVHHDETCEVLPPMARRRHCDAPPPVTRRIEPGSTFITVAHAKASLNYLVHNIIGCTQSSRRLDAGHAFRTWPAAPILPAPRPFQILLEIDGTDRGLAASDQVTQQISTSGGQVRTLVRDTTARSPATVTSSGTFPAPVAVPRGLALRDCMFRCQSSPLDLVGEVSWR